MTTVSVEPKSMKFADLRATARALGVNPAGKTQTDLIREVQKAQKAAEGKGTPADPHVPAVKERVEMVEPKEEPKETKVKVARKPRAKAESAPETPAHSVVDEDRQTPSAESSRDALIGVRKDFRGVWDRIQMIQSDCSILFGKLDDLVGLTVEPEEVEVKVEEKKPEPAPVKAPPVVEELKKDSEPAEEDDEIDETDDEDDEEEDEEEDEEGDDEEDTDDDDEDEEEVSITPEQLSEMDIAKLRVLATKMNAAGLGNIDIELKSVRVLRERIKDVLNAKAKKVSMEDPDVKPAGKAKYPAWCIVGARCEVDVEDEGWLKGTLSDVSAKKGLTVVLDDDSFDPVVIEDLKDVRPVAKKAKERS
jgi:hypothetical protein